MTERPPAQGNLVNCKRRRRGSVGWVPNWDYSWVDGGVGGGQGKQFKLAKRKLVLMMMWLLLLPGIQSIYFLLLTVAYGRTSVNYPHFFSVASSSMRLLLLCYSSIYPFEASHSSSV